MLDRRTITGITFYFKPESVIMRINNQNVCFNNFNLRNKRKLTHFATEIRESRRLNLNQVFTIAHKYEIPSISVSNAALPEYSPQRYNKSRIL